MRIRHIYPSASCRKEHQGPVSFLIGSASNWFSLGSERLSRYEGWFVEDNRSVPVTFTKIIERITYLKGEDKDVEVEPEGVTLTGDQAFWEYGDGARVGFSALPDVPGLRLQAARPGSFGITLDMRGIYQSPDLGRSYTVRQVPGGMFVQYEDHLLGRPMYLAIKSDGELCLDQWWEEVSYPWDSARNSGPDKKHVYNLAICDASWIGFGASHSAEEAQHACNTAATEVFPLVGIGIAHAPDTITEEVRAARFGAAETLAVLAHESGTYAGLPWFHQVWTRDELIAALGQPRAEQLQIIKKYTSTPLSQGELPTFIGSNTYSSDGVGWLSLLIREYGIEHLNSSDKNSISTFLKLAINGLKEHKLAENGFIMSDHNKTWMDTIGRTGARIDVQAMYALALQVLAEISGDTSINEQRENFLAHVRSEFYHKGILKDGSDDATIRPNCFLAYLLQPELLKAQEWERAFGSALATLRTNWGGLASLDRKDPAFQAKSTGENNLSYHQGDSWFFVNNLAGVALSRLGMKVFKPVIEELLKSSTEEILWKHVAGQAGEIASASDGESWGCGTQAFSAGTYLFFTEELGYS